MSLRIFSGNDDPIRGVVPIVPGTEQKPQRAILIVATEAGDVKLRLANGTETVIAVIEGTSLFPFAVKTVVADGTTAVATYANAK